MYQLIALFHQPPDTEAFDRAYNQEHLPLARKIPGVIAIDVSKFAPVKDGPAPFYQMSMLTFADRESFKTAMKSPENAAAGVNLNAFAAGLVDFYMAEKVSPHE
jgi:uncharacterized protein (TIGR02118 family)